MATLIAVFGLHELLHVFVLRCLGFPARVTYNREHRTLSVSFPGAVLSRRAALIYVAAPTTVLTMAGIGLMISGQHVPQGVGVIVFAVNSLGSAADMRLWFQVRAKAGPDDQVIDTEFGFRLVRAKPRR